MVPQPLQTRPDAEGGQLLWLPGGSPAAGRLARIHLRDRADIRLLEASYTPEQMLPALTLFECLRVACLTDPAKPAIVQIEAPDGSAPARVVTYGQLLDHLGRAANLFHDVSDGQPVSVVTILPMIPEALMSVWAAGAEGVSTAISPFLERDYVYSILNRVRATVVVTTAGDYGAGRWDRVEEIMARVPTVRRVLILGSEDPAQSYEQAIARYPAELGFTPSARPDDCATYQLTGGTTSAPKLCRLTHRGQLINAWLNGALQGMSIDGAVAHAMPNFHIGGAVVIALRTILMSQTLVTLTRDGFRNPSVVRHFWDIARRHRLTAVLATPTTAAAILGNPDGNPDGHVISAFACGGSTVPLALNRSFHERYGVWLREQWGFSEAQGTVTGHFLNGSEPVNGSIGYAFPFYEVRAVEVDEENRFIRFCRPDERGVLAVRGPLSPGYVEEALDRQLIIQDVPGGERWANSGDLGSVDADGYIWLFGRSKDVIVRGGHNIDPALIEDALIAHPQVQMAAAVGRPDPAKGEMPIAYVQLKAGESVDPAALIEHCRRTVQERAAVPVEIILVEAMPTTPVGKIFKPDLRRDALRRCAEAVAGACIGDHHGFRVELEDAGKRPGVRIIVDDLDPGLLARLQAEFANYEFLAAISAT